MAFGELFWRFDNSGGNRRGYREICIPMRCSQSCTVRQGLVRSGIQEYGRPGDQRNHQAFCCGRESCLEKGDHLPASSSGYPETVRPPIIEPGIVMSAKRRFRQSRILVSTSKAGHGNDRVWKAWKAIRPASHPFHTLWKSLRDYHIPTASKTRLGI